MISITSDATLIHYLILSTLLFAIGVGGLLMNRKNVINVLLCVELMLLAVNINFISFGAYLHDITGQIFSIVILAIAAAESAIGLAIVVAYYRKRASIALEDINKLKG